jgi:hypothetical protein
MTTSVRFPKPSHVADDLPHPIVRGALGRHHSLKLLLVVQPLLVEARRQDFDRRQGRWGRRA